MGKGIPISVILLLATASAVLAAETKIGQFRQAALTQSEVAVTSHNFREALRFLYLSAILHLQERGILTYDKKVPLRFSGCVKICR